MPEAVGAEVAGEVLFATAGEAVMADTMAIAASEVAASGLTIGGGLDAAAIAAGEVIGPGAASVLAESGLAASTLAGADAAGLATDAAFEGTLATVPEAATSAIPAATTEIPTATKTLANNILEPPAVPGGDVVTRGDLAYNSPPVKDGSILDWMNKNKTASVVGGQLISGAVQGAGAAMGAKSAAKIKADADAALLEKQTEEKLRLSREGTYTGGVNVNPSGNRVLRRLSNGQLVYVNGNGIVGGRI